MSKSRDLVDYTDYSFEVSLVSMVTLLLTNYFVVCTEIMF